jgi:hypothetical protein
LSPILVRPVREQLEHDRVIRLLQAKLKRKHEVTANVGDEQAAGLKSGPGQMFPDLVLMSLDKGHKLEGIIEVETGESVNHLEAMAQWAHFGHARAPFYLYVPAAAVDIARRLCIENQVTVSEIWSYHSMGDQTRFTLVQRNSGPVKPSPERPPAKQEKPVNLPGRRPKRPREEPAARPPRRRRKAPAKKANPQKEVSSRWFNRDRRGYETTALCTAGAARGKGRGIGSARPPASASAARRSTRRPSASSSSTTPTSSSTGRGS